MQIKRKEVMALKNKRIRLLQRAKEKERKKVNIGFHQSFLSYINVSQTSSFASILLAKYEREREREHKTT